MNRLYLAEEPDCCRWNFGGSVESLRAIVDPYDFDSWYPLDQLFMTKGGGIFWQPGRTGRDLVLDTAYQQAYEVKDFKVRLAAGVRGTSGYRTGAGRQAILGMGGLQNAVNSAVLSNGDFVFPSARVNKISRLTRQPDGSLNLSAIADASNVNSITVDDQDNIWWCDPYSPVMTKLALNGTKTTYPTPISNVAQIAATGKYIYMITRFNSWDVIMRFDTVTLQSERVAGMLQEEIDAWVASGKVQLVDGPSLNGATFHSVGLGYVTVTKRLVGGGDERQARKDENGEFTSLIIDGTWQQTQRRLGHEDHGGPEPFYIVSPGGLQPNGYPWYVPLSFEPHGGRTAILKVDVTEVPDQPPTNGGGITMGLDAKADSFTYPPSVGINQVFQAVAKFTNRGTAPGTWSKANIYRLGADQPHDDQTKFGLSRFDMDSDNIAPGQSVVITMSLKAPPTKGPQTQTYQMIHDRTDTSGKADWFGDKVTMSISVTDVVTPPVDASPTANAGADQSIVLPASAILTGMATDPEGKPMTFVWSKKSGPGAVSFAVPTSLQTQATFSVAGSYVLTLTVSDGVNSVADDVTINVAAPAPVNAKLDLTITGKLTLGSNAPTDIPTTITSIDVTIG